MDKKIFVQNEKLADSKQYSEDKLKKFDGFGKKGSEIYYQYISAIQEDKYDMTIEEACHYIGCSYTYFITKMVDKIFHIRINTAARKLINLYSDIYSDFDEDLRSLVNKRILLNRDDFFNYMQSSIIIVQQYKVFLLDNFNRSILDEIQKNLDTYNRKIKEVSKGFKFVKTMSSLFNDVILALSNKNDAIKFNLSEDYELPEKFYSLKEIKVYYNFKHDIEVYRMLDANGARKYMLCNGDFVRYDLKEFEGKEKSISTNPTYIIKIDYESYLKLSEKYNDVAEKILMQALKTSKKLAEI
jgi:hypothetical protein